MKSLRSSGAASLTLSLVSIEKASYNCTSDTACNRTNTYGQGWGIEAHTYETTVDFSQSPYKAIYQRCNFIVEIGQCCRNGAITTGVSGNYYNYLEIDFCKVQNYSSPKPTYQPVFYACCNQPFYGNYGSAVDNLNDSIVYKLVNPKSSYSQVLNYSSSFSAQKPLTAYYPKGKSFPYSDPTANPPVGIYFDSTNGDFIFTPVKCAEVTVFVIECTQYRKDTSGKYQLLSTSRRDFQFDILSNCPNNIVPTIDAPSSFKSNADQCSGIKCIEIKTHDQQYDSTDQIDSLRFLPVENLPNGITFEVINKDSLHPSGKFCIHPDSFVGLKRPINITLGVADNKCKMNAVSYKTISLTFENVNSTTKVKGTIIEDTNANCSKDTGETIFKTPITIAAINKTFTQYNTSSNGVFEFCMVPDSVIFKMEQNPWFIDNCSNYTLKLIKDTTYNLNFFTQHKPGIGGYVFEKDDTLCNYQKENRPMKGAKVVATPGGYTSITDNNGYYQMLMPAGKYKLNVSYGDNYAKACVDSLDVISVKDSFYAADTLYVRLKANAAVELSSSSNTGTAIIRGGKSYIYFKFENKNNIEYDSLFFLLTLDTNINVVDTVNGGIHLWSKVGQGKYLLLLDKLKAKDARIEYLLVEAPASKYKFSDYLHYHITSDTIRNAKYTYLNKKESKFRQMVVSAFDPNEKRTAGDSLFTTQDRYLEYVIKFQNTGSAPAKRVVLIDSIEGDFDLKSIAFLGATHNYEVAKYGGVLYIIFDDINLPDSTHNPAGSQGSVRFKIAINDTILSETTFKNKVDIYFDFEKPVTTNYQVNTFVSPIIPDFSAINLLCTNDNIAIPYHSILKSDTAVTYILEVSDSLGSFGAAKEIARQTTINQKDTLRFLFKWNGNEGDTYKIRMRTASGVYVCFDPLIKIVKIRKADPIILSTNDTSICWGSDVNFTLNSLNFPTLLYANNMQIDSFTSKNITLKNANENILVYAKTNNSNSCMLQSNTLNIAIKAQPTIQLFADTLYCRGEDSVQGFQLKIAFLMDLGYIDTVKWNFGDDKFATIDASQKTISHQYDSGSYLVQAVISTNTNCKDKAEMVIHSGYHPTAKINAPAALCLGKSTYLAHSISSFTLSNQDSIKWTFGNSNFNNVDSFSYAIAAIGTYPVSLFIKDKNGCADTAYTSVLVTIDTTILNVRACGFYIYNNKKYIHSGSFFDTITNPNKCLNIINLNLKIDPIDSTPISINSCRSFRFDTTLHTESGIYYHTYKNALFCDSVVVLQLQILRNDTTFIKIESCDPISFLGDSLTATGNYAYYLNNVNNCDSVLFLSYTRLRSDTTQINIKSCQPYIFFADTINTTGTYGHHLVNSLNCDSLVVLNYTHQTNDTINIQKAVCSSYLFNGKLYDSSGTYSIFKSGLDCDTIFNLDLTITRIEKGIKLSNDTLILDEQIGNYQWLNCSENFKELANENKHYFIPKVNGLFGAEISKQNCIDTSNCYEIKGLQVFDFSIDNLIFYPNPFSQQFTLDMEGLPGKKTIKMYDCKGQLVLDTETNENTLTLAPEINEGVYFVTIMNGDKISVGRVVKLK